MAEDLEEQFVQHVDALERICDEAGLSDRLDAAMPALDDIQDELSQAEPEHEGEAE